MFFYEIRYRFLSGPGYAGFTGIRLASVAIGFANTRQIVYDNPGFHPGLPIPPIGGGKSKSFCFFHSQCCPHQMVGAKVLPRSLLPGIPYPPRLVGRSETPRWGESTFTWSYLTAEG